MRADDAERPGPGRCDVCGEAADALWPFAVQIASTGIGLVPGSRSQVLMLAGAHCERCTRHFDVFRRRRLAAIATLVLAVLAFVPLNALTHATFDRAGGLVALAILALPLLAVFARLAMWNDDLKDAIDDELLDDLARGLPRAPGVIEWRHVKFFPGWPRGRTPDGTLAEVRADAKRIRRRPN